MDKYEEIQVIKRAILKGYEEYKGISLPTPQTTGTSTQIDSYAQLQAQRVYKKLQEDIENPPSYEELEFHDGGDGVEYELWKHKTNGRIYRVPIEVVRNFDNVEPAAY